MASFSQNSTTPDNNTDQSVAPPAPYEVVACEAFDDMELPAEVLRGIFSNGFERPSPIQQKAIRPLIEGHDLIAQAQSGTGKTGAFSVGSLAKVDISKRSNQILVLSPTHELANQTAKVYGSIATYMKGIDIQTHIGGSSTREAMEKLRSKPHVVIGTPGKIHDMFRRGGLDGHTINTVVIDEADEMFSRGFSEQVYGILQYLHKDVQVCLFSATLPPTLDNITNKFMRNPVEIRVKAEQLTLEGIKQYYIACDNDVVKFDVLNDLFTIFTLSQTIIYCNKNDTVEELYYALLKKEYPVTFVHGGLEAAERDANFSQFVNGKYRVLISSDLTARGIDIQQVSTVVNFDFPSDVNTYLHRIGRSGRWGRKGMGLNLTTIRDVKNQKMVEEYYSTQIQELTDAAIENHRGGC